MKTLIVFLIAMATIGMLFLQCEPLENALLGEVPFDEGEFVTLKQGIEEARTYHCPENIQGDSYPCPFRFKLFGGEIVQIKAGGDLEAFIVQTALLPRSSYCRIQHPDRGAGWIDCNYLVRVNFEK